MLEKSPSVHIAVVIPSYNHGKTLGTVIDQVRGHISDVIVVDDGSTDETGRVLREKNVTAAIHHERNFGKGVALRAGFKKALELGYSHVITMDADGQHFSEDIPSFVEKIHASPETLWIGNRSIPVGDTPQPGKSRFGKDFGAFWYRFHTGKKIQDTQCGFRAYPLSWTMALPCRGSRYEYEIEVLVRATWAGIQVRELPIRLFYHPAQQRVSHFRPAIDFLRISVVNSKFSLMRIFTPWHTVGIPGSSGKEKLITFAKRELRANTTPRQAATSVAAGVFFAIFPIHGFQVLTVLGLSFVFKLNRPLAMLGVSVSSAPFLPFLIAAGIAVGRAVLPPGLLSIPENAAGSTFLNYGLEWVVGSCILAPLAAVAAYIVSIIFFSKLNRIRGT